MPPLAIALIVLAVLCGFVSYLHSQRYGSARAVEMGIPPHLARSGPVNDGGGTAYDRKIYWEILLGSYKTKSIEIQALGRLARRWTLASIGLAIATMAAMTAVI